MYGEEFKARALEVLEECSGSCIRAARKPGIVSSKALQHWKNDLAEPPRKEHRHLGAVQRRSIAKLLEGGAAVSAVARGYGVSVTAVHSIRNESRPKRARAFMNTRERIEVPEVDPPGLPDDVEGLKERCAGPEPGDAIPSQAIETLKKDPSVDPSEMSSREKTAVIGASRNGFPVSAPCGRLGISRSSHCYAKAASRAPDRHARDRRRIRSVFGGGRRAFGSERIWMALECGDGGGGPRRISEKVVRRIMRGGSRCDL